MHPIIIDDDTGHRLWHVTDSADHCGITAATWRSYPRKNLPSAPVAHLDQRTPVWDAAEVRAWHANRRGFPARSLGMSPPPPEPAPAPTRLLD